MEKYEADRLKDKLIAVLVSGFKNIIVVCMEISRVCALDSVIIEMHFY